MVGHFFVADAKKVRGGYGPPAGMEQKRVDMYDEDDEDEEDKKKQCLGSSRASKRRQKKRRAMIINNHNAEEVEDMEVRLEAQKEAEQKRISDKKEKKINAARAAKVIAKAKAKETKAKESVLVATLEEFDDLNENTPGTEIYQKACLPDECLKTADKILALPLETEVSTSLGLTLTELSRGTGKVPVTQQTVTIRYQMRLDRDMNGFVIAKGMMVIHLGNKQVIPGLEAGLLTMHVGSKRVIGIPPEWAYGDKGAGDKIPSNATLYFTVELVRIGKRIRKMGPVAGPDGKPMNVPLPNSFRVKKSTPKFQPKKKHTLQSENKKQKTQHQGTVSF